MCGASDRAGCDDAKTSWGQRIAGLLIGVAFGFLLQKGGVTDYDVLIGSLLLKDFTVFEVMLSAIAVGMAGVFAMRRFGWVEIHPKPARWLANVVGGLIFGAGFGLSGYCPGTGAGALAQGSWDAGFAIIGLVVGSLAYAEAFSKLRKAEQVGDRGGLMLTDVVPLPRPVVIAGAALLLGAVAFALSRA